MILGINERNTSFFIHPITEGLPSHVSSPRILNTDQRAQFTSGAFQDMLKGKEVSVSKDGRGRAMENIFTERLWDSLKYEEVYLKDYLCFSEGRQGTDH